MAMRSGCCGSTLYFRSVRFLFFSLFIAVVAGSCSTRRGAVQEGRFQKRMHQRGWHVDLHGGRTDAVRAQAERRMHVREAPIAPAMPAPDQRLSASVAVIDVPGTTAEHAPGRSVITTNTHIPIQPTLPVDSVDLDENLMPRKKWNALAVPAFVVGLGTVALGFGSSIWLLIAGIVFTLVLAGLSMRGIRRREQAGKGFAFGAIMIGVIAALLTAISIAWYGIDQ
jgi:hypothetical protein